MVTNQSILDRSNRFYSLLLALYPVRFRTRFGRDMTQVFGDCCQLALHSGGRAALLALWLRTLGDMMRSIPSEWRREAARDGNEVDYTGLVDLFMTTVVVGSNLLGWGWLGTVIALGMTGSHGAASRNPAATALAGLLTFALAIVVGLLSAVIVARSGKSEGTRIKV